MRWQICFILAIFLATNVHAGTVNWQGGVSSDWNTALNWDTAAVPAGTDDVVITNVGSAPQINSGSFSVSTLSVTGATLTLAAGTQLTINTSASIYAGATLATQGDGRVILSGSATLTSVGNLSGGIRMAGGSAVSFNGNGTQTGNIRLEPTGNGAVFNGLGNPAIAGAGVLTLEPAVGGTITTQLNGSLVCAGTFNLNGNASVDMLLDIAVSQTLTITGTMNINAASGGEGQVIGSGTLAINSSAVLNVNGASQNVPLTCAALNNAGQFNVVTGNAFFSTIATHSGVMSIAPSSAIILSGSTTLTSTGDISGRLQPTTGSVISFNGNNKQVSAVRIEPAANDSVLNGSGLPAIATTGTLTLEPAVGGSIVTQLNGSFVCDGTFNLTGNASVDTQLNIAVNKTLTIKGTMNINANSGGEGQVIGNGTLDISSAAILNINGASNDVPISCSFLNNAGQFKVLNGNVFLSTLFNHSGVLSIPAASALRLSGSEQCRPHRSCERQCFSFERRNTQRYDHYGSRLGDPSFGNGHSDFHRRYLRQAATHHGLSHFLRRK